MYAGEQAMAGNQWKAAIEHYQVVVKAAPGNVAALNNLAWSMNEAKDPRALEVAEQAMTLAPQSAAVIDTVGIILLEKGDSKRAVELLKRAAGLAPKAADIRFHYAQALAKSGDKTAARTEAKAIEQELPEAPQLAAVREFARKL
jgi:tetratricopeptide (TPR) repeat protein